MLTIRSGALLLLVRVPSERGESGPNRGGQTGSKLEIRRLLDRRGHKRRDSSVGRDKVEELLGGLERPSAVAVDDVRFRLEASPPTEDGRQPREDEEVQLGIGAKGKDEGKRQVWSD